jgi:hypothetical protein
MLTSSSSWLLSLPVNRRFSWPQLRRTPSSFFGGQDALYYATDENLSSKMTIFSKYDLLALL